uniref:Hypothetical secreted protein n=1 Tax=Ctenocephalides felis TaxID=7515 RepID=I3VPE7_CTEFE
MNLTGFIKCVLLVIFVFLGFLTNGNHCQLSTIGLTTGLEQRVHNAGKPSSGGTGAYSPGK